MSTTLTPKSPVEFPAPITLLDAGTDLLPSSGLAAVFAQLADRSDALKEQFRTGCVSGTNATLSTGAWVDVDGASVSMGTMLPGETLVILGCGTYVTSGTTTRVAVSVGGVVSFYVTTYPYAWTTVTGGSVSLKLQQLHATSGQVTSFSMGALIRSALL